nr:ribosomal protein L13e [Candidatus Freyarchaeota archaeon]
MSEIEPSVMQSQDSRKLKAGKGFSLGELQEAGLNVHEAKRLSLRIDRRRKTTHKENVTAINTYIKERKEKGKKKKEEEAQKLPTEAEKAAISELTKIEGLNKKLAKKLFELKIGSLGALSSAKAKDLAKKIGVSEIRATLWIEDAGILTGKIKPKPRPAPKPELKPEPKPEPKPEKVEKPTKEVAEKIVKEEAVDLTKIKSLTREDAKKLAEIGILTVEDLALTEEEEVEDIAEITHIPQDMLKVWIQEAKKLTKLPKETAKPVKAAKAEVSKEEEKPVKAKKKKAAEPTKAKAEAKRKRK